MSHSPWEDPAGTSRDGQGASEGYGSGQFSGQPGYSGQSGYSGQAGYPGQAGQAGQFSGAPAPGYVPGAPYGQPAFYDSYGRPVYAVTKQPSPPKSPLLGIVSVAVTVIGLGFLCLAVYWFFNALDTAIRNSDAYDQAVINGFVSSLLTWGTISSLAILTGLILGIIATATNSGRPWGIIAIVLSVAGPTVITSLAGGWAAQRLFDWSLQGAPSALGQVLGF